MADLGQSARVRVIHWKLSKTFPECQYERTKEQREREGKAIKQNTHCYSFVFRLGKRINVNSRSRSMTYTVDFLLPKREAGN